MFTLADGKFTPAANAVLGDYVITVALKDDPSVSGTVTVTVANVTSWANKDAILDAYTGWSVSGSIDSGVGEGADLNRGGSYLSKTVTLTDLNTLTLGARVFYRGETAPGETNPIMYVLVKDGDSEVRIYANGHDSDIEMSFTDKQYDARNEFVYDLSAYAGKTVEIRIGIDQGTHCVITDVALS